MTNLGLAKEMHKMNLEQQAILDGKKAITDSGAHVKRLPLAKDGTIWALNWVIISVNVTQKVSLNQWVHINT